MLHKLKHLFIQKKSQVSTATSWYTLFDNGYISSGQSTLKDAIVGYEKNLIVYGCITRIMDGISVIKWRAEKNDKTIEDSDLIKLLENPFPGMALAEFMKTWTMYYLIHGQSFIRCWYAGSAQQRKPQFTPPMWLYPLRPERIEIKEGANFLPSAYEYRKNAADKIVFDVGPTGKSNIIHLKNPSPTSDLAGLSPLHPASYSIDAFTELSEYMHYVFKNGARPSGYFKVPVDVQLDDADKERIKLELTEKYAGQRNAGRPMVLDGGIEWVPLSMTTHDSQSLELKKSLIHDIGFAFKVPIALLNTESPKYDNMDGAREMMFYDAVYPIARQFEDQLNMDLSPRFGDGVKLCMEINHIDAVQTRQTKRMTALKDIPFLTDNEKRQETGYPEIEGGDQLTNTQPKPETDEEKTRYMVTEIASGLEPAEAAGLAGVVF